MLLDASAQHAGRTGREILTIAQRFMGLPAARVDEMLDLVSLTPEESSRRVRDYSLGMRQRLGIATALIGDPEVLILDEPANGLDPAGIRWMRGLLRDFADRGGTVLLSSHLLHEIEVIADDLVVIGNGRIVAQGAKSDLLASAGAIVRTPDPQVLAGALRPGRHLVAPRHGRPARAGRRRAGRADRLRRRRPRARAAAGRRRPGWRRCSSSSPPTPSATPPTISPTLSRRSTRMTTVQHRTPVETASLGPPAGIPLSRITATELRKMLDTRSGFWTVASIAIVSVLTTARGRSSSPQRDELTYARSPRPSGCR